MPWLNDFIRPLRGLKEFVGRDPSDKSLGYFRSSQRDSLWTTLVGEVISTVALADDSSREFNVCDPGIDMEVEFTDDTHAATGAKLYLQLKSDDLPRSQEDEESSDPYPSRTVMLEGR